MGLLAAPGRINVFAMVSGLALLGLTGISPAQQTLPVAVRFWGQAMVSIETYWNLTVVVDPYALRIGYDDPGVSGDLVFVTHEHGDHANTEIVKGSPYVIRGLDAGGQVQAIDMILDRPANASAPLVTKASTLPAPSDHAVRIRSIASFHDDVSGKKRGNNAMLVIEVNGVRILHCGDLGQPLLTDDQLRYIGPIDVLLIPVGSVYTIDGKQAAAITDQIHPRIVVPIHYKLPSLKIELNSVNPFLDSLPTKYQLIEPPGNTLPVSKGPSAGDARPKVVVLKRHPWNMPEPLEELFQGKEKAVDRAKTLFGGLSVRQLNHTPSNGTHMARWNAEHTLGRELGFFSQIYASIDPMIPHVDLNPKQMPSEYAPAHADWTGAQEARQIERVVSFTRRFAYLLDGKGLDEELKGSNWTLRGLLLQMEKHYDEHAANVKKKSVLPDWPAK